MGLNKYLSLLRRPDMDGTNYRSLINAASEVLHADRGGLSTLLTAVSARHGKFDASTESKLYVLTGLLDEVEDQDLRDVLLGALIRWSARDRIVSERIEEQLSEIGFELSKQTPYPFADREEREGDIGLYLDLAAKFCCLQELVANRGATATAIAPGGAKDEKEEIANNKSSGDYEITIAEEAANGSDTSPYSNSHFAVVCEVTVLRKDVFRECTNIAGLETQSFNHDNFLIAPWSFFRVKSAFGDDNRVRSLITELAEQAASLSRDSVFVLDVKPYSSRHKDEQRYDLVYAEPSLTTQGKSLGLAVYLACLSAVRNIPGVHFATGVLGGNDTIVDVSEDVVAEKSTAVRALLPDNNGLFFVPVENAKIFSRHFDSDSPVVGIGTLAELYDYCLDVVTGVWTGFPSPTEETEKMRWVSSAVGCPSGFNVFASVDPLLAARRFGLELTSKDSTAFASQTTTLLPLDLAAFAESSSSLVFSICETIQLMNPNSPDLKISTESVKRLFNQKLLRDGRAVPAFKIIAFDRERSLCKLHRIDVQQSTLGAIGKLHELYGGLDSAEGDPVITIFMGGVEYANWVSLKLNEIAHQVRNRPVGSGA